MEPDRSSCLLCSSWVFQNNNYARKVSATKLILLPKVKNPQHAFRFRPISCCNVIYKCITKLICQRIKKILPHIIHQSQGAFFQGRELLYNVLICQDLAKGYQIQRSSLRCLLKINIQKAFDSVHLGILAWNANCFKVSKNIHHLDHGMCDLCIFLCPY